MIGFSCFPNHEYFFDSINRILITMSLSCFEHKRILTGFLLTEEWEAVHSYNGINR